MRFVKFILPMFLYILVTGNPVKDSDTSVKIPWELHADDDTLLNSGSISLQFVRSDSVDNKGVLISVDQRVSNIKQEFYDWAYSYIKRADGGDQDFNKLITQLNGLRVQ